MLQNLYQMGGNQSGDHITSTWLNRPIKHPRHLSIYSQENKHLFLNTYLAFHSKTFVSLQNFKYTKLLYHTAAF
jgi:hypothetical protein